MGEPLRCSLAEREGQLSADETDLSAREADCDECEARLVAEYNKVVELLRVAEDRAHELAQREQESEQQRFRMLKRQQDLGGAEVRLNSLEGALFRQQSGVVPKSSENLSLQDLQDQLRRHRAVESEWAERVRSQQNEIHRLERLLEKSPQVEQGAAGAQ